MTTEFKRWSLTWNAEPNVPEERVVLAGEDVVLEFALNYDFAEDQRGHLRFRSAARWRHGATNDHGWHLGQCRFSGLAPEWGEFYEVTGDLLLDKGPGGWRDVHGELVLEKCPDRWLQAAGAGSKRLRHFLFYLRDSTFECVAESFEFSPTEWSGDRHSS